MIEGSLMPPGVRAFPAPNAGEEGCPGSTRIGMDRLEGAFLVVESALG
jgi:hypothetical protein